MSHNAFIADMVQQTMQGQLAASHALYDLKHTIANPDLLHERLQAVLVTQEPERLRAFMRQLQKRLETAQ